MVADGTHAGIFAADRLQQQGAGSPPNSPSPRDNDTATAPAIGEACGAPPPTTPATSADSVSHSAADIQATRSGGSRPYNDDALTVETANFITGYMAHLTPTEQPPHQQQLSSASELLKSMGDSLLEQHRAAISGMVSRVEAQTDPEELRGSALGVAREMFSDGHMNWGRVVALVVFCALLVKRLKASGRLSDAEARAVADEVAAFLVSSRKAWFVQQGGWNGFVREFERETPDSALKNTLMAVAGFGAMTALAALGVRKILSGFC
ncbi:anti-apoptotic protein NR13-like [Petromyzon marinus]|uniref:Anti-apoptotic protein NR13-like n=1 Tax=Petromyzon marinus TaxID=7757 RepID=A0AAJ7U780_PETMA|nr:anti-apoptotic protein NR13-like [Petromyzon marinus]